MYLALPVLLLLPTCLLPQALAPPLAITTATAPVSAETAVSSLADVPTPILELRQNLPVGAAPATTLAPGQMSPVTMVWSATVVNGVTKNVQVAYTQTFASAPGQGPSPRVGSVGMGTLTGQVGAVKTQEASGGIRSLETVEYVSMIAVGLGTLIGRLLLA